MYKIAKINEFYSIEFSPDDEYFYFDDSYASRLDKIIFLKQPKRLSVCTWELNKELYNIILSSFKEIKQDIEQVEWYYKQKISILYPIPSWKVLP
jgi:hypothetical protein